MANNKVEKVITLRSFNGKDFVVSEKVGKISQTIRHIIEDDCAQNTISIPNVSAKILSVVIKYCKKHVIEKETTGDASNPQKAEEELKRWDENFIDINQAMLFDILMAANYLDIKELLNLACLKVADMIKGKTLKEIRRTFNIKNDFTPKDEEEIRRENNWAFE